MILLLNSKFFFIIIKNFFSFLLIMLYFTRSLFFNLFFIIETIVISTIGYIFYFFDKKYMKNVSKIWSKTTLFGLKHICDLSYEIEGDIPKENVIFASQHQSAFECLIYLAELNYPKFVLKRELVKVPFAGLYFILMDRITQFNKAATIHR